MKPPAPFLRGRHRHDDLNRQTGAHMSTSHGSFVWHELTVGDIDAAIERAKAGGGQIINGPMQVPGGSWIAQALDPQGAMFAPVSAKA
jgi:predicted enzyme related to lactoylglutathione lyase